MSGRPGSESDGMICCPECSWSQEFDDYWTSESAATVDAELHWADEHDGLVPDDADFGDYQYPQCYAMSGFDGTVSCSECGHIPEEVRA